MVVLQRPPHRRRRFAHYSFHYVVFQSVLPSGLTPRLAHLGWGDHDKRVYLTAEQPDMPQAKTSTGEFDFTLSTWSMSGNGEEYALAFDVGEYALELQAASRKPPILHHGTGLVDLGRAGETYYYSRTRLDVAGTLTVAGEERASVRHSLDGPPVGRFQHRALGLGLAELAVG